MGPRNGKPRREVNQTGGRKLIKQSDNADIFQQFERLLPPKYKKALHQFAEGCFNLFSKVCCDFFLVPFGRGSQHGSFTTQRKPREKAIFYFILTVQLSSMLQKFVALVQRMSDGTMDLTACLSLISFLVFFVGYSIAASVLFRPSDTVQLLNANPILLKRMLKGGKQSNIFSNTKIAIMVAVFAVLGGSIAIFVSFYGFLVDEYPCSLYYILSAYFGVHPPKNWHRILWKFLFWPPELIMYSQPLLLAVWAGIMLLAYPTIGKTCTDELRLIRITSEGNWMKLRSMYSAIRVYTILGNEWIKFMVVPTLCSVSCAIIICLYVTIRHTEITIFIYVGFPYVGFNLLGILFWLSFEILALLRATEDIVGVLNSRNHKFLTWLPMEEKLYIRTAGRAARPARQDSGTFGAFSMNVPLGVWDEILNQLLFLLTF